ncbi:uncharacterized protein IUM83_09593 [Phytophthora cinnamomi]|uniref:uncharacterized protein n=1 Tax=Phytophthora cinnamomi TaxID=4785 RepID=UPI00355A8E2A|nr:hypothetical protein IUM83_09593 [Phytophthora cinnamomi]
MRNPGWDEDGVADGPSSMEVLLRWLRTGSNAERWVDSAGKMDGSRMELAYEAQDFMGLYGISYRTPHGIRARLLALEKGLRSAEVWMKSRGLRHHDVSEKTERAVLQMCPHYVEIKSLLRPTKRLSSDALRGPNYCYQEDVASTEGETEGHSSDDAGGSLGKRGRPERCIDVSKRARVETQLKHMKAERASCVAVLEPEPDERREFFQLELQVKRDNAVCVRAKARKELLDLGVPPEHVDRLLPL